MEKSELM